MTAAAEGLERVAGVADRLAVLLGAGLAPAAAWGHLAEDGASSESAATGRGGLLGALRLRLPRERRRIEGSEVVAARVLAASAAAAAAGSDVAAAIGAAVVPRAAEDAVRRGRRRGGSRGRAAPGRPDADEWGALAATWAVAADTGSPLGSALGSLAAALRDSAELERAVQAALAGPRASARLVQALPLVAIGFGLLLGFDTAAVLLGSPLGIGCLLAGCGLLAAGRRWNRSLAAAAARGPVAPGLGCELVGIAMAGGSGVPAARAAAERALAERLPAASGDRDAVSAIVDLGTRAGAPVVALLRAEAARLRRDARAAGVLRAERLAVRLMAPLGVCILPAFALLGVAPLLISVVTGTLGAAG